MNLAALLARHSPHLCEMCVRVYVCDVGGEKIKRVRSLCRDWSWIRTEIKLQLWPIFSFPISSLDDRASVEEVVKKRKKTNRLSRETTLTPNLFLYTISCSSYCMCERDHRVFKKSFKKKKIKEKKRQWCSIIRWNLFCTCVSYSVCFILFLSKNKIVY